LGCKYSKKKQLSLLRKNISV